MFIQLKQHSQFYRPDYKIENAILEENVVSTFIVTDSQLLWPHPYLTKKTSKIPHNPDVI